MKVYIQFDLEGVAGFVIRDNQDRNIPVVMERIRRFMKIATKEVSAAVNGAFEAGADEVVIWDSHGNGNTLLVEELPEQAKLITGDNDRGPWLPFFAGTDVAMYIGGHAMHGTPKAVTPHTKMEVNGKSFGEVGMFINNCGSKGVPVVLVTGDTAVQREIADLIPNSQFVITKEAIGPTIAKTITPKLSCKLIFEAAKTGVKEWQNTTPFCLKPPYKFKIPNTGSKQYDKYYTDPGDDFLAAYGRFLKAYYGYTRGWPEYDLEDEMHDND